MTTWSLRHGFFTALGFVALALAKPAPAQVPQLFVSSWSTDQVLRYDGATGAFLDAFVPAASGGLSMPYDLVFGPDANLYVCSYFNTDAILRYSGATGAFLDAFAIGSSLPDGLAFGPGNNLFVSDFNNNSILR